MAAGYAAGCLAAAVTLALGYLLRDVAVLGAGKAFGALGVAEVLLVIGFTFLIALITAAPFAVGFMVVGASLGLRRPLAYALFGALTGLVVEALALALNFSRTAPGESNLALVGVAALAGLVGGLLYWAVAAREAALPASLVPPAYPSDPPLYPAEPAPDWHESAPPPYPHDDVGAPSPADAGLPPPLPPAAPPLPPAVPPPVPAASHPLAPAAPPPIPAASPPLAPGEVAAPRPPGATPASETAWPVHAPVDPSRKA
jgi:hypothetical protein